jgi:hypothetical protein
MIVYLAVPSTSGTDCALNPSRSFIPTTPLLTYCIQTFSARLSCLDTRSSCVVPKPFRRSRTAFRDAPEQADKLARTLVPCFLLRRFSSFFAVGCGNRSARRKALARSVKSLFGQPRNAVRLAPESASRRYTHCSQTQLRVPGLCCSRAWNAPAHWSNSGEASERGI